MITFFTYKRLGRNNTGRITVRNRGSGIKFCKPNCKYPNDAQTIGFSPLVFKTFNFNYGSATALIEPAISSLKNESQSVYSIYFSKFSVRPDPTKFLYEFVIGQFLYDLELSPSIGPTFCRSYGSYCQLLKKRGTYATIKFPSGEIRKISVFCRAKIWSIKFPYLKPQYNISGSRYKAGFSRLLGIRPHVRGCAINPVDHPHGGRTGDSRPSVSPWAQLTKGYRTRFRPINRKFVLQSVQDFKNKSKNPT